MSRPMRGLVLERADLGSWGREQHDERRSIVMTNGCFDLLHVGHLLSLETAAGAGDRLLVALNSDASVRALKGESRPLVGERQRADMLTALRVVDAVTIFAEPTPLEVILQLRPDVLVKGSEYDEEDIVGAKEVKSWGGHIVRVPMRAGSSTSQLIDTIRKEK